MVRPSIQPSSSRSMAVAMAAGPAASASAWDRLPSAQEPVLHRRGRLTLAAAADEALAAPLSRLASPGREPDIKASSSISAKRLVDATERGAGSIAAIKTTTRTLRTVLPCLILCRHCSARKRISGNMEPSGTSDTQSPDREFSSPSRESLITFLMMSFRFCSEKRRPIVAFTPLSSIFELPLR
jgi:hypothetical protein